MGRLYDLWVTLGLILFLSLTAARAADGDVPTAADFAACNLEAPSTGRATPTMGDHARADRVRAGGTTTGSPTLTSAVIESPDPQIHGMDAEGAKNPVYQAAYRSCMRRKGF